MPAAIINALLDYSTTIDLVANAGFTLLVVGAATTGAIVAARVPGNAVGWILLALGTGMSFRLLCGALGEASATTSLGPIPGDEWLAWLGSWLVDPGHLRLHRVPAAALPGRTAALAALAARGMVHRRSASCSAAGRRRSAPSRSGESDFSNPVAPSGAAADFVLELARVTDYLACPRSCWPPSRSPCASVARAASSACS